MSPGSGVWELSRREGDVQAGRVVAGDANVEQPSVGSRLGVP